ncbi:hypothetical protein E3C22_09525 [Jiella endophytica]|uniref:Leucine-binding protein domain-containing protein n=1 Tax=Jiella endophytica TaxID=2558362 RepID=A0A4Y8RPI8_9HYPH|nr:hypothetical protein [Jiella endophytica]TFF25573.1 hypothetical protein E3C22_09525 [Jiella endophytica]
MWKSLTLVLAFLAATPLQAADIKVTGKAQVGYGNNDVVALSGIIVAGDAARLDAFLRERQSGNPSLSRVGRVTLSGDHGDFAEAVRIARLLRENYVQSVVMPGTFCADACAVAFMGGSGGPFEDTTVINPARCLQPGGQVVFSLPSFSEELQRQTGQAGRPLLRQTRQEAFQFVVELLRLAREHQWPEPLVDRILDGGIGQETLVSAGHDPLQLLKPAGDDGQSNWGAPIDFGNPCPAPLWN